eukprot:CAMPEP_0170598844 /NCGR_PEP_ID=MMETSP0224-20130122/16469_1 /TAXON_ID=285029 /ORGANISM="Togula jolla, Strain CCCM 725" /LENGTH=81 /DNA_ID=CAMNT_0010923433 /DNA_START=389 /DNA_END=637 /DNA_ORIENTATION=-
MNNRFMDRSKISCHSTRSCTLAAGFLSNLQGSSSFSRSAMLTICDPSVIAAWSSTKPCMRLFVLDKRWKWPSAAADPPYFR